MTIAPAAQADKLIADLRSAYATMKERLATRIVGMDEVVELLLLGVFSGGHCLLIGVPGLAKTMLIRSVADLLDLRFSRIQFTPDLMPSDITGTEIIAEGDDSSERHFKFMHGPVFAHIVLADEINRTPPKTQAALIEAMEERQVTSGGKRHPLEPPFFVLATENPIEQEGTYPLPATQLDRFMFNILVDYPSAGDELRIVRLTTTREEPPLSPLFSRQQILDLVGLIRRRPVPKEILEYATTLGRITRPDEPGAPPIVKQYVSWGAGPRAAQHLIFGAKVRAILHKRDMPLHRDVRALVHPVMRHRVVRNFSAEADGVPVDRILDGVIDAVPAPDIDRTEKKAPRFRFWPLTKK